MSLILSNKQEELKPQDFGKYQIPSDKIRVKDEPFELFFSVNNSKDARLFIKEYNNILMKYFGITRPMVYRKVIQNGISYDIYNHRWCHLKNGDLIENESWYELALKNGTWIKFKLEINSKFGNVYSVTKEMEKQTA